MAGARKRVENKAEKKRDLSLGDLVLAKVKGYPVWPAKVIPGHSLRFQFRFLLEKFNFLNVTILVNKFVCDPWFPAVVVIIEFWVLLDGI